MTTANPTPGEPAELDALVALAHREHRAGRLAEAAAAYRQILARRPDVAEMHNNLGNVLADQGKLDEAAAQYERAVALKPSLFQTHNSLGNLLWKQGKLDQAVARLKQALALEPNLPGARNNLGCILRSQGKAEEAAAQFERALALKPDLAEAHNNLGNILWQQSKLDQALARYERALALAPDYAEAHNNLGNALMELGKFDEARAHYDQAIALKPEYAEAHYHRTDLKTFHAGDADLAALEALATENRLPPGKMLYVHFALGKALEDIGEYPRAFEHLLQANALKRRELPYDEAGYQRAFRTIAERFDETLLERFAGMGDPSATPIFIVGMPRSGSTLVEQILASHPLVHAAGELKNLDRVVETLSDPDGRPIPYLSNHRNLDADGLRRMGHCYLVGLPTPAVGTTRITDKAPSNFFHIGLIRLMLPNARIIHTLRNPVDTCVSCFARLFAQGQSFSYDLAQLGGYYRWYHDLMEHWRSVLPAGALLDVAYEELVDNLEPQARTASPAADRLLRPALG
jgi:Tfp pilus assembly protein PilF